MTTCADQAGTVDFGLRSRRRRIRIRTSAAAAGARAVPAPGPTYVSQGAQQLTKEKKSQAESKKTSGENETLLVAQFRRLVAPGPRVVVDVLAQKVLDEVSAVCTCVSGTKLIAIARMTVHRRGCAHVPRSMLVVAASNSVPGRPAAAAAWIPCAQAYNYVCDT